VKEASFFFDSATFFFFCFFCFCFCFFVFLSFIVASIGAYGLVSGMFYTWPLLMSYKLPREREERRKKGASLHFRITADSSLDHSLHPF